MEKTLESPLNCKVNPKGNQPWIFIGRTDAKAEVSILWPPDAKSGLIGKDPDAGKDCRPEEKWVTEDEMVGWLSDSMDMSLSKLQEMVKDREAWSAAVCGVTKYCWTWLSDWTRRRPVWGRYARHDCHNRGGWLQLAGSDKICQYLEVRGKKRVFLL